MQDHRYATLNKSLFNPFIPSSSFTFLSAGEFLFINFYFQTASTMGYSSKKVLFMIKHLTLSHCSEAGTKNECFPEAKHLSQCQLFSLFMTSCFIYMAKYRNPQLIICHQSQNNSMKTTIDLVNDDIQVLTRI